METRCQSLVLALLLFASGFELKADEVALKRTNLPRGLRPAVVGFINTHYQRGCGNNDAFQWMHVASTPPGGESDHVSQFAGMSWAVTKQRLGEGDRRNGVEFRGTLVITATASRHYYSSQKTWSQWSNGGDGTHFDILKDTNNPDWVIRPNLSAFEYKKISCEALEPMLSPK
jgi:hypothetical protein